MSNKIRKRVFCFLPKKVYSGKYIQDGFVWLGYAYKDDDGKHYRYSEDYQMIDGSGKVVIKHKAENVKVSNVVVDDCVIRYTYYKPFFKGNKGGKNEQ